MIKTLALVSCGKSKTDHLTAAQDLYIGDLFKKSRNYVERNHDAWMILSALHGLVDPKQALSPYEYTLIGQPQEKLARWAKEVHFRIVQKFKTDTEIYIYAGSEYRKYLIPLLEHDGYKVFVPLQGLGIGQQKSWFKKKEVSA